MLDCRQYVKYAFAYFLKATEEMRIYILKVNKKEAILLLYLRF